MLSVIISSYKKHDLVKAHVRECMNSTYMPDEIIVVNDGAGDDLKDMLLELDIKTRLVYAKVLEDIPWNYTGARNLGFWLSTGNYISIEDDDHIPHKDYYKLAIERLDGDTEREIGKIKSHKRWVVEREDIVNKPVEEWKVVGSRPAHQDVTIVRRELYLKLKGYDERFAGAYGWSATDWKRRSAKVGFKTTNIGYQYVMNSPKTRGLSSRNWQLARRQKEIQSPKGILNFQYTYEVLSNKK